MEPRTTGEKSGRPLLDPRTVIRLEDVAKVLQAEPQGFDAIMLDVDNGPEGLTQKANSWLYSAGGLAACAKALRPKGVLAVWSASADKLFSDKLRKAGFKAEEVQVFAHGNKGTRHTIWIAEKLRLRQTHKRHRSKCGSQLPHCSCVSFGICGNRSHTALFSRRSCPVRPDPAWSYRPAAWQ